MSKKVQFGIGTGIFLVINLLALWIWGEGGIGGSFIFSAIILFIVGGVVRSDSKQTYVVKRNPLSDLFNNYYGTDYLSDYPRYRTYVDKEQYRLGILISVLAVFIGVFGGFLLYDNSQFKKISYRPELKECNDYIENDYWLPRFHKGSVKLLMDSLMNNSSLASLYYFGSDSGNASEYKQTAAKKVQEECEYKYRIAVSENTIGGWTYYRDSVECFHRGNHMSVDSINKKIKYLMNHGFDKEKSAWKNAKSVDEIWAYNEYLNKHPNGKHEKQAIDALVNLISAGNHGELPSMEQVYYGGGTTSDIDISNDTEYTLTLLYSGTESKRLVLPPRNSTSITLYNGTYAIAASVDASNVRNYAGTEHLNGGSYAVSYYISTTYGGSSLPYLNNPRY